LETAQDRAGYDIPRLEEDALTGVSTTLYGAMDFAFGWPEAVIVWTFLGLLLGIDLWRMKSRSLPKWRYVRTIGIFGLLVLLVLLCVLEASK
jgi:hypothetical protein